MTSADSLAIPASATKTGCATIDIRIGATGRATATPIPALGCGPITPEIAGAVSVDAPAGALRMPVALHNAGEDWLHGPASVTVPRRPPDSVSRDELLDSRSPENVIVEDPHFPGRVVRDKLWLLFRREASAEDREAAIESVNGIVVGGTIRGSGNRYPPPHGPRVQRYYYVRIPAYPDSGAAPLERAIQTLAVQPAV
jgi:hypothetical protein